LCRCLGPGPGRLVSEGTIVKFLLIPSIIVVKLSSSARKE
jgi:hypothetical protein